MNTIHFRAEFRTISWNVTTQYLPIPVYLLREGANRKSIDSLAGSIKLIIVLYVSNPLFWSMVRSSDRPTCMAWQSQSVHLSIPFLPFFPNCSAKQDRAVGSTSTYIGPVGSTWLRGQPTAEQRSQFVQISTNADFLGDRERHSCGGRQAGQGKERATEKEKKSRASVCLSIL